MSVTVVNPLQLLRELFTVNGAGTLIRRGSRIDDARRLGRRRSARAARRCSTRRSAGRCAPTSSTQPVERIYVEEDYLGAGGDAGRRRSRPT